MKYNFFLRLFIPISMFQKNYGSSESTEEVHLPVVNAVNQFSFEIFLSFKGWHVSSAVNSDANHDGIKYLSGSITWVFSLPHRHWPATSAVLLLFHWHHFRLKPDVLLQPEMIHVHPEVLKELGMVHVVREVGRHQKVAVASELLRCNRNCWPAKHRNSINADVGGAKLLG